MEPKDFLKSAGIFFLIIFSITVFYGVWNLYFSTGAEIEDQNGVISQLKKALLPEGILKQEANVVEVIPLGRKSAKESATDQAVQENKKSDIGVSAVVVQKESRDIPGEVAGTSSEALSLATTEEYGGAVSVACSFNTGGAPSRKEVVINELAWMGTANSFADEWIELKNFSDFAVDISGWWLIDPGEKIKLRFDPGAKISARGFYILERTDDSTLPNIAADDLYKGDMSNSGGSLRLFDENCVLIDEILAASGWPAGDNVNKNTMERKSDFSWQTSASFGGTPKAENSSGLVVAVALPFPAPATTPISSPAPTPESEPEANPQPDGTPSSSTPPNSSNNGWADHVVISEIQAGTDVSASDEFVELYNPTETEIDLTGWVLKKRTSTGSESNLVSASAFKGKIKPKSFFLITHSAYKGSIAADLVYSVTSNNLAYSDNAAVLYSASGAKIDEVSYTSIDKNKSFERKAFSSGSCVVAAGPGELLGNGCDTDSANDFDMRNSSDPQNTSSSPEP